MEEKVVGSTLTKGKILSNECSQKRKSAQPESERNESFFTIILYRFLLAATSFPFWVFNFLKVKTNVAPPSYYTGIIYKLS